MIDREFPFEECVLHVHIQSTDRSGHLWGVVDIRTLDGSAHLISPQRMSLFEVRDWLAVAKEASRRNSGNAQLWEERGEQIRVALIEDPEIAEALVPSTSQLHTSIYMDGVVKLEIVRLSQRQRPGPRQFRVQDLIPEGWPVTMWGDSGHGKSYLAGTLGQCVTLGHTFLGLQTVKGPVLYADWELDEEEQTRRAYEVAEGLGLHAPPAGYDYVRVDYPFADCLPWFKEHINANGYKLMIIDSFGLACGGDSEASRFVIPFFQALRQIRCSVLIVDHQSRLQPGQKYRDKDAFGSIYKKHLSRSGIQVQVMVDEGNRKGLALRHAKANFSPKREAIYAWLEFKEGRTLLSAATSKEMEEAGASEEMGTKDQIKAVLRELGLSTIKIIAAEAQLNEGTVRNEITRMKKTRDVVEDGKEGHAPLYRLADATDGY